MIWNNWHHDDALLLCKVYYVSVNNKIAVYLELRDTPVFGHVVTTCRGMNEIFFVVRRGCK